jgi:hypothetical protein
MKILLSEPKTEEGISLGHSQWEWRSSRAHLQTRLRVAGGGVAELQQRMMWVVVELRRPMPAPRPC